MRTVKAFPFFSSWSGGKDSCLALYRMLEAGHQCVSLFTMIDETGKHSRSHGLSLNMLKAQAGALGLPIRTGKATWQKYEDEFIQQLNRYTVEGIVNGVFGDIDLQEHWEWVERVCEKARVSAHEPLWQEKRSCLVREFVQSGFKALIVVVNTDLMPECYLGRHIAMELVEELEDIGVDACGENGEYHSFVHDGPLFRHKIDTKIDKIERLDNYRFLRIHV